MKLRTPDGWYRRKPGMRVSRLLLTPLSWIWAMVTARRIATTIPVDVGVPVICVGNLTLGGTGKTPVVRALVRHLADQGVAAHALSRGHGGRLAGPVRVDPAQHKASDVGDEALMLARTGPMWIGRDRVAAARSAAEAGAGVIVMDDGHQNPALAKTLSLVVVDGETRDGEWPFGDGAVFPAGPMRERLDVGLARADAVVVVLPTDRQSVAPDLLDLFAGLPVLIVRIRALASPPVGPQVAFAGVGKPWKVERALRAAGCMLAEFVPLADHQPLDQALLQRLDALAKEHGAELLTTEKDWVRLPDAWQDRVRVWPIEAVFEDPAALEAVLQPVMSRAQ